MITDLSMAPLRGVTVAAFRDVFADLFGGLDRALAPFVPTVAGDRVKPALLKDVAMVSHGAMRVVPQVIGKDPAQLAAMVGALRDLGHTEVNLNVGCPWKFVAKKGRGAGLLADADALRRMLDAGCGALPAGFSVKVRLGLKDTGLLARRIELLNQYPLAEVVVHPRTAEQMYGGEVHLDAFEAIYREFHAPVTYNGDLYTVEDFRCVRTRFPGVTRWMLGRGLVADPFLPAAIRAADGGQPAQAVARPPTVEALRAFHDALFARCRSELFGPASILGRMKELWGYLHERCEGGGELLRRIQRCHRVEEYERWVEDWFARVGRLVPIRPRIAPAVCPDGTAYGTALDG